jgi:hypothetical protein
VAAALAGTGARRWQIGLILEELTAALADPTPEAADAPAADPQPAAPGVAGSIPHDVTDG